MTRFFWLKKFISYLVDIQLDKAKTALNPELNLSLRNGRFYLTTTNAVYSYGDLYDNFLKAFQRIDFSKQRLNSILVLGFGMGSVPYMLEKVFRQRFTCIGIEADFKIVEWANKYATPDFSNDVKIIHSDASDYVETSESRFDLIVVDVFLDDLVPENFSTKAFLTKCSCLLNENGLLLFNRLADTTSVLESTMNFYADQFKKVFPAAEYLDVGGNWILASKPVFTK